MEYLLKLPRNITEKNLTKLKTLQLKSTQIIFASILVAILSQSFKENQVDIFNGKNFLGWEGDTLKTWKIQDKILWGGSLTENVPLNNFLCTKKNIP